MDTVGFVGGGKMAEALAQGILAKGLVEPDHITICEPLPERREHLAAALGVRTSETNPAAAKADVVVLAVKPQVIPEAMASIRDHVTDRHLVVSIAAGVTLAALKAGLPAETRLVRVMPNTPCLVGEGAAGFACGAHALPQDADTVQELLTAVGRAFQMDEKLLDTVTGLSGSGPAYVYLIIEALADGGVREGLPRDAAQVLAAQTVLGAAKMVLDTGQHPGALKDAVMSPAGTTAEGIFVLEQAGMRGALMDAVAAATQRCRALGSK